jgi:hypothetical protein
LHTPSSFIGDTAFISYGRIRHPRHPITVRYRWEPDFVAYDSHLLRPADLLAPLTDPTPLSLCRLRLLLRSFRSKRSLFTPSDMTTVATGQVPLAGTSPAGLAASFAAPVRRIFPSTASRLTFQMMPSCLLICLSLLPACATRQTVCFHPSYRPRLRPVIPYCAGQVFSS